MAGTGDKLMTASEIKEVTDTKLDKDFSSLDTSGGFSLTDTIPVNISGTTYKITGQTLSNAIGGGGGSQQASLTNYVKNCGTISVLPVTLTDSNITSDMIVIEYTIGDETALGSDWTVTTADGSLTISGTLNKSTTLELVLSVGYSATPSILTDLTSDTADNILKANPRPGVTGVLPILHGGFGSSTASGARTNLSVYSKSETDSAISQATADKAYKLVLTSSIHDTWAKVYDVLSALPLYETGTIYSGPASTSVLTDGGSTTNVFGTIVRTGSATVYAELTTGTITFILTINDMTNSSRLTRMTYDTRSSYFSFSSATTFTIPSNSRFLMLVMDSSATRCGLYFVPSSSAGTVTYAAIGSSAEQTTITTGTNSITITPASGSRAVLFINAYQSTVPPTIAT